MKQDGISVYSCGVSRLFKDLDAGRFAIPRLQREFVWNGPKAAKLLDSLFRGMPVGVMLIRRQSGTDHVFRQLKSAGLNTRH